MPRGKRKERRLKRRLMNRKPAERYEWLLRLRDGSDCILRIEDKYRIYRRLEDEFAELSELTDEEAESFTEREKCAELSEECGRIADEMEPELPEDMELYSRTEMMTAGRRHEEDKKAEGSHSVFRWVLLCVLVLIVALLVCHKIPVTRAVIGSVEEFFGFNSFAIKSYRVAGEASDGWQKAVDLEKKVIGKAEAGAKVKFGKSEWIVLTHMDNRTLLIAEEPLHDRAFHNTEGAVTWLNCHLREYLNDKYLKKTLYPQEEQAVVTLDVRTEVPSVGTGDPDIDITRDRVFIASEDEVWDYEDILDSKTHNMLLRDPGENEGTTAFVSSEGDIVDYGYPADMSGCAVRPMMWVESVPPEE